MHPSENEVNTRGKFIMITQAESKNSSMLLSCPKNWKPLPHVFLVKMSEDLLVILNI